MKVKQYPYGLLVFFSIFALLIASACSSDESKNADISSNDPFLDADLAYEITGLPTSMQIPFFLNVDRGGEDTTLMLENPYYNPEFLNVDTLVKAFNLNNPDVQMEFVKHNNDTLFVKIMDATYLTQQMGTEGAIAFISEAVYGFTILPKVNVVNFEFKEGDHAVPGNYTRDSFINY